MGLLLILAALLTASELQDLADTIVRIHGANPAEAGRLAEQGMRRAEELREEKFRIYFMIAMLDDKKSDPAKLAWAGKALRLAQEGGYENEAAQANLLLCTTHRDMGDFDAAQAACAAALAHFEKAGHLDDQALVRLALGRALVYHGRYVRAVNEMLAGLPNSDKAHRGRFLNLIALAYHEAGRYQEASGYFRQAADAALEGKQWYDVCVAFAGGLENFVALGDMASAAKLDAGAPPTSAAAPGRRASATRREPPTS